MIIKYYMRIFHYITNQQEDASPLRQAVPLTCLVLGDCPAEALKNKLQGKSYNQAHIAMP